MALNKTVNKLILVIRVCNKTTAQLIYFIPMNISDFREKIVTICVKQGERLDYCTFDLNPNLPRRLLQQSEKFADYIVQIR